MDLLIELKIISYLKINAANPLRDLYININIVHIYCTLIVHFYIDFNKQLILTSIGHLKTDQILTIYLEVLIRIGLSIILMLKKDLELP